MKYNHILNILYQFFFSFIIYFLNFIFIVIYYLLNNYTLYFKKIKLFYLKKIIKEGNIFFIK